MTCPECGRTFDPEDPTDAAELAYGHDCEPPATTIEHRPGVAQPHTGLPPAPWAVVRDGRIQARYYSREMAEWSADLHNEEPHHNT